jgi:hypothetical protein
MGYPAVVSGQRAILPSVSCFVGLFVMSVYFHADTQARALDRIFRKRSRTVSRLTKTDCELKIRVCISVV